MAIGMRKSSIEIEIFFINYQQFDALITDILLLFIILLHIKYLKKNIIFHSKWV